MPGSRRIAIVLFNLGGPDSLGAVKPFLFNLFNDRNIINLPQPFRWMLAKLISSRRAPVAQHVYEQMGGRSPILPNTEAQAAALETLLAEDQEIRCFIAMRYWHPLTQITAQAVKEWGADEVILLPLYPQFSTTTTASSYRVWSEVAHKIGLNMPQRLICCYPDEPGFITAMADNTHKAITKAKEAAPGKALALIFSAHGLPQKIVDAGDPYVTQVETTVKAVVQRLGLTRDEYEIAYQSRVGPLKWVGPATDETIVTAARQGKSIVVIPVAFVSEHSETLVELDIEYAHLAKTKGAAAFTRAATVATHSSFITGLANLVRQALTQSGTVMHDCGKDVGTKHTTSCLNTTERA